MHELDAMYTGEWVMFGFLNGLTERTQMLIFLFCHIPFIGLLILYLNQVYQQKRFRLFLSINLFGILHTIIHLVALNWRSNVFLNFESFFFVLIIGITAFINLIFYKEYQKKINII